MNSFWSVSAFWIIAFLLVLVALAFVLPPLLRRQTAVRAAGRRNINIAVYRDQLRELEADQRNGLLTEEQFAAAKVELEARLAQDAIETADEAPLQSKGGRFLGLSLGGLLPLAAFGVYFLLGNPEAMMPPAIAQQTAAQAPGGHDFAAMLEKVEAKVRDNPNDVEALIVLANTYGALDRWPDAAKTFERAAGLQPGNATIWAHYAEALAITGNRVLTGQPMALVRKALELDPQNPKALELAGINAFQDKNYAQAAYYWKQLSKQLSPEDPYAKEIETAMREAKRLSEEAAFGPPLDNLSEEHAKAMVGGPSIGGMVELAPALKDKVKASDVVFLFARPVSGGGAPLAAIRVTVDKLPAPFHLDDSMAMMPDNKLSNHESITLTARISKSGTPEPRPGDLEGRIQSVKVGSQGVKLVIDTVRQ